jgi:hypothetical protein
MPPLKKTPKAQIVDTYTTLINEYFTSMSESAIMREIEFPTSSICIGVNIIHRVFEMILMKTKSIEKTYYYAQRASCYYLEYLEQIYRANLFQNLNNMDIILFVYKKTIFDTYDGDNNDSSHTLTNIMTLTNETIVFNEKEWTHILMKVTELVNVLSYWENATITFVERQELFKKYLLRFMNKIEKIDTTLQYLAIIQEKIEMTTDVYDSLLCELVKSMEGKRSPVKVEKESASDMILMKFYLEEGVCREKFEQGPMRDFVKWLLV